MEGDLTLWNYIWITLRLTILPFLPVLTTANDLVRSSDIQPSSTYTSKIWDENGYLFYCPCHGRFGNQADQFLGSLAFAKRLNRTMVLAPWRTYGNKHKMIPFDDVFQVALLQVYHRVILAKDFVEHLAPQHWPLDKRKAFCHKTEEEPCTVNQDFFREFWDYVGIPTFSGSESVLGLRYELDALSPWKERFPGESFPVIALRGPPAPFPVPLSQWPLQKYLVWSDSIQREGDEMIEKSFGTEPFLGIHLRNGVDWRRACDLLKEPRHGLKNLMASTQCLGENPEAPLTMEMCLPTKETVIETVTNVLKRTNLNHVYIATDNDPYIDDFRKSLPDMNFVHLNPKLAQLDLYILGRSHTFIGNCPSSFSSFVRRERDVTAKPTLYFGLEEPSNEHGEL